MIQNHKKKEIEEFEQKIIVLEKEKERTRTKK